MKILPVGIQHSTKTKSIIGNGVIIDAKHLNADLNALSRNGIDYNDRLYVSNRYERILRIIIALGLTLRPFSTRKWQGD